MIALHSNIVTPVYEKKQKKYQNYRWSKHFYKKINEKICPCCHDRIIRIGREIFCNYCDLNIIGSPETIAYYDASPAAATLPEVNEKICPECEGLEFEHSFKRDETVCKTCGLVLSGPPAYSSYIKINYPSRLTFDSEILWIHPKTQERVIGYYYPPEYYRDPDQL